MKYAAARLSLVQASASATISARAKALRAAGEDVIDLGLGEPDFDTPPHIIEAAHQAALNGQTRYPPTDGTQDLKQAIIAKFARDNDLTFQPSEVFVSNGAKQVIFAGLMATMEPNQEVLLVAPYFDSYENIVQVLGGEPVTIPTDKANGYRITSDALAASITKNTRWLILNYPSNPSGAVYSEDQLQALGEVIAQHPNLLVLSDEIYEHILFDDTKHVSFARACPELKDRILTVNGVSKAYAMTGWRIGYGAGPTGLIQAMTKVQSQISSGACSIAQAAATAALNGPQDEVTRFRKAFEARRDLVTSGISAIKGLHLDAPKGAFYALIDCTDCMGTITPSNEMITTDADFVTHLLNQAKIASVPGSVYGAGPAFRISLATSEALLQEALTRIRAFVASLTFPKEMELS